MTERQACVFSVVFVLVVVAAFSGFAVSAPSQHVVFLFAVGLCAVAALAAKKKMKRVYACSEPVSGQVCVWSVVQLCWEYETANDVWTVEKQRQVQWRA